MIHYLIEIRQYPLAVDANVCETWEAICSCGWMGELWGTAAAAAVGQRIHEEDSVNA